MAAWDLTALPEVFRSTDASSVTVSRALRRGRLRRIGPSLYTTNLTDPPADVVRRNLWMIAGLLFPGALVADRTALEGRPAPDGSVFLAARSTRTVELPGLVLRARRGVGPVEGDQPFIGGLYLSSPARAYLENVAPARRRRGVARRVSRVELEQRLDDDLRTRGEDWLNRLRDQARTIAPALGLEDESREIDALIGTLLGTRRARVASDIARARVAGLPFDPHRLELFAALRLELSRTDAPRRPDPDRPGERVHLPFFEAYFSNFIEGTEFPVDQAADIVFRNRIPEDRPADAHDILGTYRLVASRDEMTRVPRSVQELDTLLRARHAAVMEARPDRRPGEFKREPNRAGATLFVAPDLVRGTLVQGFDVYRSIAEPFHRAVFMMFLISEVHPFVDGNGRVARIMMNAELVAAGERRIVIPTVFRSNYLEVLKALSQSGVAEPLVRALNFAQRYTAGVDFSTYEGGCEVLRQTNAFLDPRVADEEGRRLRLPS